MGRILALDYGLKRIGVAVSDDLGTLAFARDVLQADAPDLMQRIQALCKEDDIETVIIGRPLPLNGKAKNAGLYDAIDDFAKRLREFVPGDVVLEDERMTSKLADRILRDAQKFGASAKAERDSIAAAVLLQGYLDSHQ